MIKSKLKVEFVVNNPQKEAKYLCFLAKDITKGLYQKDNFYVLPYAEKLNIKAVYFPDLKYSKDFWKKISDCKNMGLGGKFPKECTEEVLAKLPKSNRQNSSKIISSWRKIEKSYFDEMDNLFVGKSVRIKSVEILLTEYGTLGSFNILNGSFVATHRTDIHPDDIGRKILYLFTKFATKENAEIGENAWYERRTIVNHLLEHTKLRRILPGARNTAPRKKEAQLKKDSDVYLAKLGFCQNTHIIKISQWGKITINDKDINQVFTQQEEQILKTLIKNKGEIVTFSDFDKIPSLYALAKVMENIREKIRNLGINREIITTVRGKGYIYII